MLVHIVNNGFDVISSDHVFERAKARLGLSLSPSIDSATKKGLLALYGNMLNGNGLGLLELLMIAIHATEKK